MKFVRWLKDNLFFVFTLFFIAFIPLYPKRPLLDVHHTWVYIRVEDFLVALAVVIWTAFLLSKKFTLKTPLTFPILAFWIIGGISTLHAVILIFPTLSEVFSNVAFLSFLRRIEYMSLFFLAYTSMKDKRFVYPVIITLVGAFFLVVAYGFGQKYLGFPAYLTMNEEFAKGIPIQLSSLSRVPSTFAGHYDLAAYLVLVLPIFASLFFGIKNWIVKAIMFFAVLSGFGLMFMTVSRVSFFVLLVSLLFLLILLKKKILLLSIFFIGLVGLAMAPTILSRVDGTQSLLARFGNTVKEVDVLVDVKTGRAVGHTREVEKTYFQDKIVYIHSIPGREIKDATSPALLAYEFLPPRGELVTAPNEPTGEDLPQGTGYVNLPLSPVHKRVAEYFYQNTSTTGTESAKVVIFYGDYVIKRALAYDLSSTTRLQGEWPKALKAFKRNIFLGSGYSSVTLAVDNNYLRILGESGLLGFVSFLSIFLAAGIYIKKVLPSVESSVVRSLSLGFIAGTFGLALNAVFIDVFEASKIAFSYWLLMGVVIGLLHLYKDKEVSLIKELRKAFTSVYAIVAYLLFITIALYSSATSAYFVGDDFTWLRWAADCGVENCRPTVNSIVTSFTEADGFFFRPGTKIYFQTLYSVFWLNQSVYHLVSVLLHFAAAVLVFLIASRIFKDRFMSSATAFTFLALSGHSEAVFWISSTGYLFNAVFALLGLYLFILWRQREKVLYFIASLVSIVLSMLFHEVGVIVPFLIIAYDVVFGSRGRIKNVVTRLEYYALAAPILPYLTIRFAAQSHWFNGDYSYDLLKLPFNFVGNIFGYFLISVLGTSALPLYQSFRSVAREYIVVSALFLLLAVVVGYVMYKYIAPKIEGREREIIIFAILFFVISLLPFLGLGNITSRYSYLATFPAALLLVMFFRQAYYYLTFNGRELAGATIGLVLIVFVSMHLFQIQETQKDWMGAGDKTEQFLLSLNKYYSENVAEHSAQFYFVDVPIKHGDAWVFPVGLEDALWLTFRNDNLHVYSAGSLPEAFEASRLSENARVFKFEGSGDIEEYIRTRKGVIEKRE